MEVAICIVIVAECQIKYIKKLFKPNKQFFRSSEKLLLFSHMMRCYKSRVKAQWNMLGNRLY